MIAYMVFVMSYAQLS